MTDPILHLVSKLAPSDATATKAPPAQYRPTIGAQVQTYGVPNTFHNHLANFLATIGNDISNHPVKSAISAATMAVPGVDEVAPEVAAMVRGAGEAAPAVDSDLAARNLYSSLPKIAQGADPAIRDRSMASLMDALPKTTPAAPVAAPVAAAAAQPTNAELMNRFMTILHATTPPPEPGAAGAAEMARRFYGSM